MPNSRGRLSPPLDFVIAGAQKAGTTSLFQYLRGHPDLIMPAAKEAPFVTDDAAFDRGWDSWLRETFGTANLAGSIGTATPDYLADPRAAKRLSNAFPDLKLIFILRNPVERVFSHYKMAVRRGQEIRPFHQAVAESLTPDALARARKLHAEYANETECYVVWGEYARLLRRYRDEFPRENILLLETGELGQNPTGVVARCLRFLNVDESYKPMNLGMRYHFGGTARWIPNKWVDAAFLLRLHTPFKLLPVRYRKRLWYWFEQRNTRAGDDDKYMPPSSVRALASHYRPDVCTLIRDWNFEPGWLEMGL